MVAALGRSFSFRIGGVLLSIGTLSMVAVRNIVSLAGRLHAGISDQREVGSDILQSCPHDHGTDRPALCLLFFFFFINYTLLFYFAVLFSFVLCIIFLWLYVGMK